MSLKFVTQKYFLQNCKFCSMLRQSDQEFKVADDNNCTMHIFTSPCPNPKVLKPSKSNKTKLNHSKNEINEYQHFSGATYQRSRSSRKRGNIKWVVFHTADPLISVNVFIWFIHDREKIVWQKLAQFTKTMLHIHMLRKGKI